MSDSFTQMVERYRKELALYGAQAAKASPGAAIPKHAEREVTPVPVPEIPTEIEPEASAKPEEMPPEKLEPEALPELEVAIPERAEPMLPDQTETEALPENPSEPEETQQTEPEPTAESPQGTLEQAEPEAPAEPAPQITETEQNGIENAKLCHPYDTDSATLVVQVYTARQAIPVPNADVSVYCGDGDGKTLIAFRSTNEDGKSDPLRLAAPNRAFSETPTPPVRPYAVYRVRIDHPEYISTTLEDVQLFGGIESILPVELTPYIPFDEPKPMRGVRLPEHALSEGTEANEA